MYCPSSPIRCMAVIATMGILVSGCAKRTSQTTRPADEMVDLSEHQWKNRIVLVFNGFDQSPKYNEFMDVWSQAEESVKDRDLLLFEVFLEGASSGPRLRPPAGPTADVFL